MAAMDFSYFHQPQVGAGCMPYEKEHRKVRVWEHRMHGVMMEY